MCKSIATASDDRPELPSCEQKFVRGTIDCRGEPTSGGNAVKRQRRGLFPGVLLRIARMVQFFWECADDSAVPVKMNIQADHVGHIKEALANAANKKVKSIPGRRKVR
eukprot:659676-Hanusia_phi.AAC.5